MATPLASLPSVDRLLNTAALRAAQAAHGREPVTAAVRAELAALRDAVRAGDAVPALDVLAVTIAQRLDAAAQPSLRPVVNLTGTVLHTNLGRALLPEAAIAAMAVAARSPVNLEMDLADGARGERDAHVERLLRTLTGAEAALVVNNNAAAVLLMLSALAPRGEVIVSRGELVEIGGQFRIPDIMARSGARLREIGTTNRTHLADYQNAIGPRTAMLLKVHTSNYEVRGFTSSVDIATLAPLAREHGLPLCVDLGSGTLVDLRQWDLPAEPTVGATLAAGADLVTFSGDKLLGGPQCGVVAGRKALVDRLRRHPLKRALRVDKLVLAALEAVLALYLDSEQVRSRLPTLRLLARPAKAIAPVAESLAQRLRAVLPQGFTVETVACMSQIGSGALPVDRLPSVAVRIASTAPRRGRDRAVQALLRALRALPLPIVGRIEDHAVLLDCRCLDDAGSVADALSALPGALAAIEAQAGARRLDVQKGGTAVDAQPADAAIDTRPAAPRSR